MQTSAVFSVDRGQLVDWMAAIGKSFTFSGQLHEIFKCVVIRMVRQSELEAPRLDLEVADGVSYAHIRGLAFDGQIGPDFSTAVSFDTLQKILLNSGKDRVKFEWDYERQGFTIYTESRYKLPGIDADAFPVHRRPTCEMRSLGDLQFLDTLDRMIPLAAKELARPELAGVSVSDEVYVSTVGTHGAIHKRQEDVFERITIGPYAIKFLNSINRSKIGDVKYGTDRATFIIESDSFTYSCVLAEAEFPWEALNQVLDLRNNFMFKAMIDSVAFQSAVRRVLILDTDKFAQLGLQFAGRSLVLSCKSALGTASSAETIAIDDLQLPDGAEEKDVPPLELRLSVPSVDALTKLYDAKAGAPMMITVIAPNKPIFVSQKGSSFIYYTQIVRPI
jgi:hypothetical protein